MLGNRKMVYDWLPDFFPCAKTKTKQKQNYKRQTNKQKNKKHSTNKQKLFFSR